MKFSRLFVLTLSSAFVLSAAAPDADAQRKRRWKGKKGKKGPKKPKPAPTPDANRGDNTDTPQERATAARKAANQAAAAAERAEAIAVAVEKAAEVAIMRERAEQAAREAAEAQARADELSRQKDAEAKEREAAAAAAAKAAVNAKAAADAQAAAAAESDEAFRERRESERDGTAGFAKGSNNDLLDNAVDNIEERDPNDEVNSTKPMAAEVAEGDFAIEFGGFARLHADYDNGALGTYTFNFQDIPPDTRPESLSRQNVRLHARQSRVWMKSKYGTPLGDVNTYMEFDFQGGGGSETVTNSASPRIRHAYGELGGITAGMTWSGFSDPSSWPETANPTQCVGVSFVRQPLIKAKYSIGKLSATIGVENPQTETRVAVAVRARPGSDSYPDTTANIRYQINKESHIQISGLSRNLSVVSNYDDKIRTWGYAGQVTGRLKLHDRIRIGGGANGGPGIGRYILVLGAKGEEGIAAISNPDAPAGMEIYELRAATAMSFYGWLQVRPLENVNLNVTYGHFISGIHDVYADQPEGIPDLVNYKLRSVNASIFYHPTKRLAFGSEVIWGHRETYNDRGKNVRVGVNTKFNF